ncbi:hypothetical protein IJ182_08010 [bacterium]|nr:hypothetical protein [bacterium]
MASLVTAIRNIMSDAWWFIPVGIFTGVLFMILDQLYHIPQTVDNQTICFLLIIYFFLLIGVAGVNINRNINNKSPFFPGIIAIPETILKSVVTTLAIAPGICLAYGLYKILTNFHFEQFLLTIIFYSLAIALVAPFILIPAVLCNARSNPLDAFRFNILFEAAGNVIVQMLSYLIQYILIVGSVTAVLYFFLLQMLGDHFSLLILLCLLIVITFLSIFSYASDMYGDVIPEIKEKEVKRKKTKNINKRSGNIKRNRP